MNMRLLYHPALHERTHGWRADRPEGGRACAYARAHTDAHFITTQLAAL